MSKSLIFAHFLFFGERIAHSLIFGQKMSDSLRKPMSKFPALVCNCTVQYLPLGEKISLSFFTSFLIFIKCYVCV